MITKGISMFPQTIPTRFKMIKVGLLSDTHGSLPDNWMAFFEKCDEIWHAGDIGSLAIADTLSKYKFLRAVFGNIDGAEIRAEYPDIQVFEIEKLKVVMLHIGGYPGKYQPAAISLIRAHRPGLFVSGHSHILKVIYDKTHNLLHINPGAAGKYGLHQKITMLRFALEDGKIKNLEVFEKER